LDPFPEFTGHGDDEVMEPTVRRTARRHAHEEASRGFDHLEIANRQFAVERHLGESPRLALGCFQPNEPDIGDIQNFRMNSVQTFLSLDGLRSFISDGLVSFRYPALMMTSWPACTMPSTWTFSLGSNVSISERL